MAALQTYLNFDGNCEEAFNFYKSVLGGEFSYVSKFSEMPAEYAVPAEDKDKIMHISLQISEGYALMGSDRPAKFGDGVRGNLFSISYSADSKESADKVFSGLAEGGEVVMPMEDTFWGSYFGMLTDKYGISWMVSFNSEPQH